MHSEFSRGAALISLILLQHRQDESLLELPYTFRIKNVAAVHLQDECFQLIFHSSLFLLGILHCTAAYFGEEAGEPPNFCGA